MENRYREIYMLALHRHYEDLGLPENSPYLGICQDHISKEFCNGSGYYSKKNNMICFRCEGKGNQTEEDVIRNRWYDYFNRNPKNKVIDAMKQVRQVWKEVGIVKAYEHQKFLENFLNIKIDLINAEIIDKEK